MFEAFFTGGGVLTYGIPDPMAILFAGRTSTPFMLMWGTLGLFLSLIHI